MRSVALALASTEERNTAIFRHDRGVPREKRVYGFAASNVPRGTCFAKTPHAAPRRLFGAAMHLRKLILAIAAAATALSVAACNRDTGTPPKPKADSSQSGSVGGPASTEGGLKGQPSGGTPAGAATSSTPQGMAPGASTSNTDRGGLASRPTEGSKSADEPRPNAQQK
jgi:hypothetical protein